MLALITSLVGAGMAGTAVADNQTDADLEVEQPYADGDVNIDTSGNYTTYEVAGSSQLLTLEGVDENATVLDYGTEESEAHLSEHDSFDAYEFETDSDGTYHVYFAIEYEQDSDDGNETETVREDHVAQLSVSDTDTQIVAGETLDEYQSDADRWSNWESDVRAIAGDDVDVDQQTDLAGTLLNLRHNPTEALTGEFLGIVLMLFITTSGLAVLALFGLYHLVVTRQLRKRTNERESLEAEEADLEEKLTELDDQKRNRLLVNTTMFDHLEDEWSARAMHEDLGEDAMSAWLNFTQLVGAGNLLKDRLIAMGKDGYRAAVTRGSDDQYATARLVHPQTDPECSDDEELVALEEKDKISAVADAIAVDDTELVEYDLREHDTRLTEMGPELSAPDSVDELVEELDAELRRFQGNEEEYTKYLLEFVEHVREHPFTDAHGRPKRLRYVLSSWLKTAQINRDMFGMPLADMHAEFLEKLLQDHDPAEDADIEIEQHRKGVKQNAGD
ncbi:hypothetical protein BB347_18520 (plasmid) [Natronorubrum daqingense]|nr:hypothetical protein BB347_18520 [Natronorubrum daqingense]